MSAEWRTPSRSFASVLDGLALLLMRVLLFWRSEPRYSTAPFVRVLTPTREAPVSESPSDDREGRRNRATAIVCAAVCFRGEIADVERLLGLADEFLDYIEGDDTMPIPRPDKVKGKKR